MVESKESLSEREIDILRLVATGAPNKEIARQLVISPNTVKVHLRNIFAKIGVTSRTEATLYAMQTGLVTAGTAADLLSAADAATGEALPVNDASSQSNAPDAPASSYDLPGIVPEDGAGVPAGSLQARLLTLKAWQIGLAALAVFMLIGAGIFAARLFIPVSSPATSVPPASAFASATSRWADKAALPAPRKGMGTVMYESNFYFIAGETAQGVDNHLLSFDPAQNTWKEWAKKPTAVSDVQAVLLGERIYVPGGRLANGQSTDILEVYNPRQDKWETKASLPVPISAYALAAFEGDLYLFGGKNGSRYSAAVYQYDPKADHWEARAEMSAPRAFAAAVADSEKIAVIGGYDGQHALTLAEVFFPTRDASSDHPWESLPPLPKGRYAMGIAHLANVLYLLGGLDDSGVPSDPSGLQFAAQSNQWQTFENPTEPIGAQPALFTLGNYLYTFGGETAKGLTAAGRSYQAIFTVSLPIQTKP